MSRALLRVGSMPLLCLRLEPHGPILHPETLVSDDTKTWGFSDKANHAVVSVICLLCSNESQASQVIRSFSDIMPDRSHRNAYERGKASGIHSEGNLPGGGL